MTYKIHNVRQGSAEWFRLRMGIPTSSNFECLLKKGRGKDSISKERQTYMLKLIGERITRKPMDNATSVHFERGHAMEPRARVRYYLETGNEIEEVGFITKHDASGKIIAGSSTDGFICDNGIAEIKSKLPHLQLAVLLGGVVPPEHMPQIQGGLWVSEREFCDFVSYWPDLLKPFIVRVNRDEEMIERIADEVRKFNYEMEELHERLLKEYGE